MGTRSLQIFMAIATFSAVSCHSSAPPSRSPSVDYPPPAQETSQGEVIGADRVPPGDKLRSGPQVGSRGVIPAEGPTPPDAGAKKSPLRPHQ
jgi:hypothetical protein